MYLTVDKGPMFSGKTTSLCKRYRKYMSMKNKPRIGAFSHSLDERNGKGLIFSHDGLSVSCKSIKDINEIDIDSYEVIFIDEGQFFVGLYDFVKNNFHKNVTIHVAGLNGDKNQDTFGDINRLSPLCSEEKLHKSVCFECGNNATFSKCLIDSNEVINIGSENEYQAVCGKCLSNC
jgi:thymidine kinase